MLSLLKKCAGNLRKLDLSTASHTLDYKAVEIIGKFYFIYKGAGGRALIFFVVIVCNGHYSLACMNLLAHFEEITFTDPFS